MVANLFSARHPMVGAGFFGLLLLLIYSCTPSQLEGPPSATRYPYLYPVCQDGLWGFIDSSGAVVIKPQFEGADHFYEGLALVQQNGAWGYLRLDGTFQIQPRFRANPQRFSEGLARARFRDRFGFIDTSGKTVIPDLFLQALPFSDGLSCAMNDAKKWGFINRKGEWVVQPMLPDPAQFGSGLYPIERNLNYGYADTSGRIRIPTRYDYAQPFREGIGFAYTQTLDGVTVIREGLFLDTAGRQAVPGVFSRTLGFQEGLAGTQKGSKWGYIDRNGNAVVPFTYDMVGYFNGPLAPVYVGYAKDILPAMATDVVVSTDSSAARLGYVNRQGRVVYEPTR